MQDISKLEIILKLFTFLYDLNLWTQPSVRKGLKNFDMHVINLTNFVFDLVNHTCNYLLCVCNWFKHSKLFTSSLFNGLLEREELFSISLTFLIISDLSHI